MDEVLGKPGPANDKDLVTFFKNLERQSKRKKPVTIMRKDD